LQAASQHRADFRQCGEDFRALVLRQRKVDATVVEAVLTALQQTLLGGPTELAEAEEINTRKRVMQQVYQTEDKRTVRRRLARSKAQAPALGITQWVSGVEEKLPQLIGKATAA
jgi:hypothetical protein